MHKVKGRVEANVMWKYKRVIKATMQFWSNSCSIVNIFFINFWGVSTCPWNPIRMHEQSILWSMTHAIIRGINREVSYGISGDLGSAGWTLSSLWVVSLVYCVAVFFFVVVSFFLFLQVLCLCGLAGWDVHSYMMLVKDKILVNLDLILMVLFLLCFISI